MQRYASILLGVIFSACTSNLQDSQNFNFSINGTIDSVKTGKIYLQKAGFSLGYFFTTVDSANLLNGSFHFEGIIEAPEMYYLRIAGTDGNSIIRVFLLLFPLWCTIISG